jgi:hypothetical protein
MSPSFLIYTQTYDQAFRVADSAYDLFELYVGEDVSPDFSSPPAVTSATLPFNYTPTPPATGLTLDLHLVVRKRNAFNLQSFNVWERIVTIDSASAAVITITPPLDVAVYDASTLGFIKVIAKYVTLDDPVPADTWEVFVTIGSDPDPLLDVPAFTGSMSFLGVEAMLQTDIGPYPYIPGTVAHVVVVAKRTAGSEVGIAGVVLHTLAISLDLSLGEMFGGGSYEQR